LNRHSVLGAIVVMVAVAACAWQPLGAPVEEPGVIVGAVYDAAGAPLPDATLTIEPVGDGAVKPPPRGVVTDAGGQYRYYQVTPGLYRLRPVVRGEKFEAATVRVSAGRTVRADFRSS